MYSKRKSVDFIIGGDKDILSSHEFSLKIAKIFNLDSSLIKPIKTSELSQIAKRPLRSGLIQKMEDAINVYPPSIEDCLKLINSKQNNEDDYNMPNV